MRVYSIIIGVLLSLSVLAAPRYGIPERKPVHWIGLAAAGFEANPILRGETTVKIHAGGGGQLAFLYELQKNAFFFSVGVGADYALTNTSVSHYDTAFAVSDYKYRYMYNDYAEQQSQLRLIVPVRFGCRIGRYAYLAVGASYRSAPIGVNTFSAQTKMFVQGEFVGPIEPIIMDYTTNPKVIDKYRFWSEDTYRKTGSVQSATHEIAAELEVGAQFDLGKKTQMRIGVYGGYDIPVIAYAQRASTPLTDYSALDEAPVASSQKHLSDNLVFHSMLDAPVLSLDAHRLRAGLRLTFLFRVSNNTEPCRCKMF